MQLRRFRMLSAITAGSLALAVVAVAASSGTSQTITHAALAAGSGSFSPVSSAGIPPGQLNPGQRITSGTQIASPDGKFVLQCKGTATWLSGLRATYRSEIPTPRGTTAPLQ